MDLMNSVVSDSYGLFGMEALLTLFVERFAGDYKSPVPMTRVQCDANFLDSYWG